MKKLLSIIISLILFSNLIISSANARVIKIHTHKTKIHHIKKSVKRPLQLNLLKKIKRPLRSNLLKKITKPLHKRRLIKKNKIRVYIY